jgi:hypothetical protein
MATYGKRLPKKRCDSEQWREYLGFAIPMSLPYNTERNFRLLQSVASLLLRSREVIVYPLGDRVVPLHFLLNHEPRRGILVDIVSGAPYVNRYPGFVSIAKSLKHLWYNVRITCGVDLEFYDSRGGCVKLRTRQYNSSNGQLNSSNGAVDCRRLDEVERVTRNWAWNPGGEATPYYAAQFLAVPYEDIIEYIFDCISKHQESLKAQGLWDYLNPDYLEKASLAYREHCIEGKECETVEWICVNEKWCRSSDVEDGAIALDGDIDKYILNRGPKIFRDLSSKVGVIGGLRVKIEDEPPFKKVVYKIEPSPIVKILARYHYKYFITKKNLLF